MDDVDQVGDIDLHRSVEEAQAKLTAPRAQLEQQRTEHRSPETERALEELQRMLDLLRARYGVLHSILERGSEALFAKDRDGRYVMINPQGAVMFGRSVDDILGRDDTALFAKETAARIMDVDRAVMSSGTPQTFEEVAEIGGAEVALLTTETAWYDASGAVIGLIGSTQDVTDRRREERGAEARRERMRALASEVMIAEEHLRQTLAAEIHNGLGQDIALVKMKLSALRDAAGAEVLDQVRQIEALVEQADRSLRSITFRLNPPALHDLGLVPALQGLADTIHAQYGFDVRIEDDATPAVDGARLRTVLFRAVREILINAAKHSGAGEAVVSLDARDGMLRIEVTDRGAGFDPDDVDARGYGLFGIREQLRGVNGSMQIESARGSGTRITLTAPHAFVDPVPA